MKKIFTYNFLLNMLFSVAAFIFIYMNSVLNSAIDMDYWARLLQGNAFFELGHILKADIFSYTPTHIWLDHEWGASVIFSFIQNNLGYSYVLLFKSILVFLLFLFIYKTIKLSVKENNLLFDFIYFVVIVFAIPTITQSWLRCHIFTFLFFVISLFILEKVRLTKKYKLLFLLPVIMLFWVNIHGGCVSLLGLLFIYSIGEALNKNEYKYYLLTLLFSIFVMFINPYGIEYVKFIFMASTMPRPFVTEWISPFSHPNRMFLVEFKLLYLINLVILLFSLKNLKRDYTKYLLLIICAYLSFRYVKNTPFFIIVSAIFLYNELYNLIVLILRKLRINIKYNYIYILLCFILICFSGYNIWKNIFYIVYPDLSLQPVSVVRFIKMTNLKGNILAPFDMGSYIAYKLYPNNLIYMDGRYEEVYYNETKELLDNFYNLQNNWDEILDKEYNHDYIIVPKDALLNDYLSKRKDYKIIYSDNDNFLYIKSNLKYKINNKMDESIIYDLLEPFKTSVKYTNNNK